MNEKRYSSTATNAHDDIGVDTDIHLSNIDTRYVITDYVAFEIMRSKHSDAKRLAGLIDTYASIIEIAKTPIGEALIQQHKILQRYNEDPVFRRNLDDLGLAPTEIPPDAGQLSIISCINGLKLDQPVKTYLILSRSEDVPSRGMVMPVHVRVIPFDPFHEALQRVGT
jgi:hypothetical protein